MMRSHKGDGCGGGVFSSMRMKWVFPDLRFRGPVAIIMMCLAGTLLPTRADAQAVSAEQFAAELAARLGYRAPFVPESERPKVLRKFLAGKSHEDLPPQSFLTGTPNISLSEATRPGDSAVTSTSATGEVEYSFDVIRPGQLRAEGFVRGGTQLWQINEGTPVALNSGTEWSQVELPAVWLDAGEHRLRIAMPAGGSVGALRVNTPCVQPILPTDLQGSEDRLTFADKTTGMVRALDREDLLPDADEPPVTVNAEEFDAAHSDAQVQSTGLSDAMPYLESAGGVSKATFTIDVKQKGVYTLKAIVAGGGAASWDVNGCRVSSMPPARRSSTEYSQEIIGSVLLEPGTQKIEIALRPGLRLAGLSLQRKKTDPDAYADAARAMGLAEGAPGDPVTQEALQQNMASPLLDERRNALNDDDRDTAGLVPPTDQYVFGPTPGPDGSGFGDDADDDGDGLPSDDQDDPYHSPVSPYLPDPGSGAGAL